MRSRSLALVPLALFLLWAEPASADWQLKPFVGLTFGGGTTFVDVEKAAGKANTAIGVSGVLLGEVFGLDADLGRAPGFFQTGNQGLLKGSRVTTLTGNVVVALPKRMAGYSLRPYLVAGTGLMHVSIDGRLGGLDISRTLPALDFGGGATGFLSDRFGLTWEVRHFHSIGGDTQGASFGKERLSFWRATMGAAIRY